MPSDGERITKYFQKIKPNPKHVRYAFMGEKMVGYIHARIQDQVKEIDEAIQPSTSDTGSCSFLFTFNLTNSSTVNHTYSFTFNLTDSLPVTFSGVFDKFSLFTGIFGLFSGVFVF